MDRTVILSTYSSPESPPRIPPECPPNSGEGGGGAENAPPRNLGLCYKPERTRGKIFAPIFLRPAGRMNSGGGGGGKFGRGGGGAGPEHFEKNARAKFPKKYFGNLSPDSCAAPPYQSCGGCGKSSLASSSSSGSCVVETSRPVAVSQCWHLTNPAGVHGSTTTIVGPPPQARRTLSPFLNFAFIVFAPLWICF